MIFLLLGLLGLLGFKHQNISKSFVTSSFSESSCVIGEIVPFSLLSVGVDERELSSIVFFFFFFNIVFFFLRHYDEHKIKNKIK